MKLLRTAGRPPFTSAHRGHSTGAPENTLAALDAAWRAGATVAEIDVRMTRDGELVLLHDRTLDRTTTGHGPVSACTLAELASSMPVAGSARPSPASRSRASTRCSTGRAARSDFSSSSRISPSATPAISGG